MSTSCRCFRRSGRPRSCYSVRTGYLEDADRVWSIIAPFIGDEVPAAARGRGSIHTILFTDMERNTELLQRLGDERWRALLREHERITRSRLAAHGGTEIKTTGDGFMVSFASAADALECALGLQRAFAARNAGAEQTILVRCGLNAGEPIAEDDDLFGTAVTVAARIMSEATGGEVLVSDVVRQLAAGKRFAFEDAGIRRLRGFDEPVQVWAVRREDAGSPS
jgi:adenylate cyclase